MSKELNLFETPLSGISLVEAGAGTGKTYNIASLFVRVILEKKVMPPNILVLTYTEAATAELKSRLRTRIKESIYALEGYKIEDEFLQELKNQYDTSHIEILKKALYQFDEAAVSTIHGFCQRLLKENSVAFGVSSEFEIMTNDHEFLQEIVDNFWRDFLSNATSEFQKSVISFMVDSGYYPDNLMERVRLILGKPYATHLPKEKLFHSFEDDFYTLKEVFAKAKSIFLEEEKEIQSVLEGDSLNGSKYRNRERHFEDVKTWLRKNEFSTKPADRLYLFSSFMKGDGKKKGKEVPELKTFEVVDEYLKLADSFSAIEISWLKYASKRIEQAFEEAKQDQDLLTYNDLLIKVEKGIQGKPELSSQLSEKYPVALIDEFQDTDPIQYSIFQQVYSSKADTALFMIGDPKQAIYSFRGADIYTYIEARENANAEQKYSLSSNFRSSKPLIESINKVFTKVESPFLIDELSFSEARFPNQKKEQELILKEGVQSIDPLQFIGVEAESSTAEEIRESITSNVCLEILNVLSGDFTIDDNQILESDIAVLVRTHYQAQEIQNQLRNHGIKSIINSKESVFTTKVASELYMICTSIADPSFEDGIRAALTTEAMGFSAKEIRHLLENEAAWDKLYQKFLNLNKLWKEQGFLKMSNELLSEFKIEFNYAEYFDAERRITNTYHIFELLEKVERVNQLSSTGLVNYFKSKKNGDTISGSEEEIVRLESDDKLVQIITMHASKGLEYAIVFCPYLWEGISTKDEPIFAFHEQRKPFLDIGSKNEDRIQHREAKLNEELAERVRLTYVALTRAKVACFVFVVDGSDSELSPFSLLMEGKNSLTKRISDKLNLSSDKYKSTHKTENTKLSTLISAFSDDFSSISYRAPFNGEIKYQNGDLNEVKELKHKHFSCSDLFEFNRMTSFSSLSQNAKLNLANEDKFGIDYDDLKEFKPEVDTQTISIFSLPKGAKTGTLLHEVFEEIHFNVPTTFDDVIQNKIQRHGFSDIWKPVLQKLVRQSVNHILYDDFRLSDFTTKECLIEMEFHFPVSSIGLRSLLGIIRVENFEDEDSSISGFMKGFIDLIFVRDGKYFILDYKSNFLGDSLEDYNQDMLGEEVLHSNYDLQYHIYILALHRMLSKSIPDYSYDAHFGGVFYLFLRGVDPLTRGSGVYFDKPDFSVIQALDERVKEKEEGE